MWKKLYDKKYMTIAAYALAVIASLILLTAFVLRFSDIRDAVNATMRPLRPIFFALILSYFCNPMMKIGERYVFGWLDRYKHVPRRMKRVLSLILSYLLILSVIAGILFLTVPEIVNNYVDLIENLTDFLLLAVDKIDGILGIANEATIEDMIIENSHTILSSAASIAASFMLKLSSVTFVLILSWVLSFFMLLYKESWAAGLRRTVTALSPKKLYAEVIDTLNFANRTFGRYLLGSVFDSVLVGCETFVALWIFDVPYRAVVSVLVGLTNIIPYFGPFIGSIPAFFIILTQDTFKAFLFVVLVLVIQQIDGNLINPRIIGKTTSINSMWVIIAITLIGGWLGIFGMLIAIPLFSVIYMLVSRYVNTRLARKGLPTDREYYESSFSVSHYRKNEPIPQSRDKKSRKEGEE